MTRIVGIDYSLSCPAICVLENDIFNFHYLTSKKKLIGKFKTNNDKFTIRGYQHEDYYNSEDRFDKISNWAMTIVNEGDLVNIEGYSFGSSGMVFQIAENAGILKHKLYKKGIKYQITPPSASKKLATGKGSAKKELMCGAFVEQTGFDIFKVFGTDKSTSPINDIVDAYFLCKFIHNH